MDAERPPGSLYDFIYIDRAKIASLYAQIFGGHLISTEKAVKEKAGSDVKTKVSIGVGGASLLKSSAIEDSLKQTLDPHDVRVIDVLSHLMDNQNKYPLVEYCAGSLVLMDNGLIKIFTQSLDMFSSLLKNEMPKKIRKSFKQLEKLLVDFLKAAPILPAFLLTTPEGNIYGGTLKEEFLSEPISSFYLKQGNNFLKDIHLIGIKEEGETLPNLGENHLYTMVSKILPVFSTFIFPEGTKKIIPLAILRRL